MYTIYDLHDGYIELKKYGNNQLEMFLKGDSYDDYVTYFSLDRVPDIINALQDIAGNDKQYTVYGEGLRDSEEGKPRVDLVDMSFVHDVMDYWSEGRTVDLINGLKGTELHNYDPLRMAAGILKHKYGEYKPNDKEFYYYVLGNFVLGLAERLTEALAKYPENNWKLLLDDASRLHYSRALLRHVTMWLRGDDNENHLYASMFNLMGIWYWNKENEVV